MRKALPQARLGGGRKITIPAPIGGWNASDALAAMPATDAVYLDNFFPQTSDVTLRKGYQVFATLPADTGGSPHNIKSLLGYKSTAGSAKVFAACEDGIYEVTSGGAIASPSTVVTGNQVEAVNITTSGGSFLWCCNGVDKSRYYNGSAWTLLDGASVPALTGVTSTSIAHVNLFKTRLIFCLNNSLSFYYLPVNSVAGAATEFPLGAIFRKGGYLMASATWTIDGGDGADDLLVLMTSEGEVAVYKGIDPDDPTTWGLTGVYYLGKPLSRRCFQRIGGDVLVMTVNGVYPLSKSLLSVAIDRQSAISYKIQRAYNDYVQSYQTVFGWQMTLFPEATMLLVNVPLLDDTTRNVIASYQFVMNTTTGAWCRFTNQNAQAWLAFNGSLYFAAHNVVYKAWNGSQDLSGDIIGKGKAAFSYLGSRGYTKQINLVRAIVTSTAPFQMQFGIDVDFSTGTDFSAAKSYLDNVSVWDEAIWGQSRWSGGQSIAKWESIPAAIGGAAAIRLRIKSSAGTMAWTATEAIATTGGVFG